MLGVKSRGYGGFNGLGRFSHYLLLIQVFSPQNIPGFIIIGAIYLTGIFMTWRRARGFIKQEKVVLAE